MNSICVIFTEMWALQQRWLGWVGACPLLCFFFFFLPVLVKSLGAGAGRMRCGRCPTLRHLYYSLHDPPRVCTKFLSLFVSSSNWNACMGFSPHGLQACRYLKGWSYFQVCYFPEQKYYSLIYQGNKLLLEFGRILGGITPVKKGLGWILTCGSSLKLE